MTDIEIWRTPISDGEPYEGYKVSNLGRILSLNYHRSGRAELMNPGERKDGYLQVILRKNRKKKMCLVHRLIAETFLPNPNGKPCINHKIQGKEGKKINMVFFNKDGTIDKERNTIEWATYEENNNYATRNERVAKALTNGKKSKKVLQFTLDGDFIREYPSIMECERNGFNRSSVCLCCQGKHKSHKGFRFMYK